MMTDEMTCPDCAETIKAEAKVCKHCSYRFDTPSQSPTTAYAEPQPGKLPMGWMIGGGGVIATACAGIIALNLNLYDQGFRADNPELEQTAKSYFAEKLADPSSAQYDDMFSNGHCVTGKLNARNGFGGYVGYQDFYYDALSKSGEVSPGMPNVAEPLGSYKAGLKNYQRFRDAINSCINGEPVQKG